MAVVLLALSSKRAGEAAPRTRLFVPATRSQDLGPTASAPHEPASFPNASCADGLSDEAKLH